MFAEVFKSEIPRNSYFEFINFRKYQYLSKMLTEKQLVDYLDKILVDQIQFQTYVELQITNKHLDLAEIVDQDQIRIDLAGINQIDGSIHFFEAETQLHVQHPAIYRKFCDYCYLVCPDNQFDYKLDSETRQQQFNWAIETGLGIITISDGGKLRVRVHANRQNLDPIIRKEVLRLMNKRFKIRFDTVPLWERTRRKITS